MLRTNNNIRIAKNAIYLYLRMIIVLIINLYITRLLLQVLGVVDFGILNVVGGVIAFVGILKSVMANGFQRFFNYSLGKGNEDKFIRLVSVSVTVQLIISAIVVLIGETIGLWFFNTHLTIPSERLFAANILYQTSILIFIVSLFSSIYNAIIIAFEKMHLFAVISVFYVVAKLFSALLLFYVSEDHLILYGFLSLLIELLVFALFFFYAKKINKSICFRLVFDKNQIREILNFSGWNLFGAIAHTGKGQGLNIILNMFFDPSVNAARGIAYQVHSGLCQCYQNVQMSARPQIIKSYAKDSIKEMVNLVNNVSRLSFMLLWVFSLPIIFNTDFILHLWLGENVPKLAVKFTNIVLITTLLECFSTPISNIVHATGKMKKFQMVTSFVILLILPLSYFVLKFGGEPHYALYCSMFMAPVVQAVRIYLVKELVCFSAHGYIKKVLLPCIYVSICSLGLPLFMYLINAHFSPIFNMLLLFVWACISVCILGCTQKERQWILLKINIFNNNKI